jgi:hypothetical protein
MKLKKKDSYVLVGETLYVAILSGLRKYYKYQESTPSDLALFAMRDQVLSYCMLDLSDIIDWENDDLSTND